MGCFLLFAYIPFNLKAQEEDSLNTLSIEERIEQSESIEERRIIYLEYADEVYFTAPDSVTYYLIKALKYTQPDTNKVKIYLKISENSSSISIDSSMNYARKALIISKRLKSYKFQSKALAIIGDAYMIKNKQDEALKNYLKAENAMNNLPLKERDAYTLFLIADRYNDQESFYKAEEYYNKTLKVIKARDDVALMGNIRLITLLGLVTLYKNNQYYEKALAYYQKVDKLQQAMGEVDDFMAFNKKELGLITHSILQDIKHQQTKKRRDFIFYLILISIVILLALALIFFIVSRKQKRANELLEAKNQQLDDAIEKSDTLLLNILPKEIAEELKSKGKASIRKYDCVSVLFTDFKGFTQVSEKMTPEELIEELDDCFANFDDIVAKYNLEKIKTIGDAYMCAGGIPKSNRNNPFDIVLAGLEIQRFMQKRRKEKELEGKTYWQCRLGINTGTVIAGVIGKSKFVYDIWGDTVNTASRTESNGEVNKVNITQNTYEIIEELFDCEYRGKVKAKGKGEIDMYFVNKIKTEVSEKRKGVIPNQLFWKIAGNFINKKG